MQRIMAVLIVNYCPQPARNNFEGNGCFELGRIHLIIVVNFKAVTNEGILMAMVIAY